MKSSIRSKLDQVAARHADIHDQLADASVFSDISRYEALSKEMHALNPLVEAYQRYQTLEGEQTEMEALLDDEDNELRQMAQAEWPSVKNACQEQLHVLHQLLLPKDPCDDKDIYLEIRAGAGGQEAALFVLDLQRMYQLYAQGQGWRVQVISAQEAEQGGCRELVMFVKGQDVYASLKFESGTHRVQRVPITESQGRIHTSTCTVAILPEMDATEVEMPSSADLRIDTFRSSGAGGQHVNTTDSAVRITHLPTGLVVECQDERSQHKNKAKAMKLLLVRLADAKAQQVKDERSLERKLQVGSGDRSERIRTYNFPQSRITDHRINLTLYQLQEILDGQLQRLIEPLMQEDQAKRMANLDADNE